MIVNLNRGFLLKASVLLMPILFTCNAEYFTQQEQSSSIQFQHNNGNSQQFYYPEIVGSGVALFDFDNDGDLDIYLLQSGTFKNNTLSDKLFINQLNQNKNLTFKDVSKTLKLNNFEYGIAVATADINHDGWVDLYVSNLRNNKIMLNQKGKGFKVIKQKSSQWSTGASFCDINNDGFEDLYVSNYVNWSKSNNPKCYGASSKRDYCGPDSFKALADVFYLYDKEKLLIDKTASYFPNMPKLPGLNVVCRDVNNDGWNDFVVANDGKANLLWLNQKGQSFKEYGLLSGLAVNAQGVAEASMGVAVSDFDLDGDDDVFFTHLMNETNTLYQNSGKGFFQDITNRSKLATGSFSYTGWSAYFLMVNDDIYPDLVVFNGAVADTGISSGVIELKQTNQLYLNAKQAQFTTVTNEAWLQQKDVSRGVAFGDLDNDGDVDMVVNNNNGKAQILLNNLNPKTWTGFQYSTATVANLKVELSNKTQKYLVNTHTDGGYASAHDARIVLNQAQVENFKYIDFYKHGQLLRRIILSKIPHNQYNTITLQ